MRILITMLVGAALLASCQPEPDQAKLLDQLVVQTNYDTEVDFSQYTTYRLTYDTIGFVSNRYVDTILVTPKNGTLPRTIVQRIESNMNTLGMERVDTEEEPDLGVIVFIVNDVNLFQEVIYGGYYYPYNYYNYYSYYSYPYVQTYASNTGGLVIEFVDLKNRTPDNKVKVVWTTYMGDVITTVDREQQIVDGIDQAFRQSPYLTN